jgi:hypothetical protein
MPEPDAKTASPITSMGTHNGPERLREMRAYYSVNGAYRTEDIQRVLGDPRTVVGVPADRTIGAAALGRRR